MEKRYSREFKLEAVRLSFESGKPAAKVARELGVPIKRLYKWRDEFTLKQDQAFPGKGRSTPNDELERLRRENKRLKEERDILKKSLIFFAKQPENDSNSSENPKENSR